MPPSPQYKRHWGLGGSLYHWVVVMSCVNSPALLCSGCRSISYCSAACQRGDWPAHKLVCWRVDSDTGTHFVHRSSVHLHASPATTTGWCPADRAEITTPAPLTDRCSQSTELVCSALDSKLASVVPDASQRGPMVRALSVALIQYPARGRTGDEAELKTSAPKRPAPSPSSSSSSAASAATPMETSDAAEPLASSSSSPPDKATLEQLVGALLTLDKDSRRIVISYLDPETWVLGLHDSGSEVIRRDLRDPYFWGVWWTRRPVADAWLAVVRSIGRGQVPDNLAMFDALLSALRQKVHALRERVEDEALFYGRGNLWLQWHPGGSLPSEVPAVRLQNGRFGHTLRDAATVNMQKMRIVELSPFLPASLTRLNVSDNQLTSLPATLPASLHLLHVSSNQLTSLPATLPPTLIEVRAYNNPWQQRPPRVITNANIFIE